MSTEFKPFHEMTAADYAEIGLRCGLEVHRQLDTETKLFCRCPAGRYGRRYDTEILRHMRPTMSELGEYDGTALMEKKTRKNIYYRIHHDTVCTYEFDDTPPFPINDDALDIAIELALSLHLNMVGELHIARKQYLDGSIPAGFQRTTILGVNGWIPYRDRRIGIMQLGLEEDSCREVSDVGHDRVYLTDRLGMPLIEVVTDPDMRTPQELAEVGWIIRKLCRDTGKVRTGYGAARQDVNVSVTGGTRIEIKGVPQIPRIPRLVYNEARRQCSLLRIRDLLANRGVTEKTIHCAAHDVTRAVAKAQYGPIRTAIDENLRVKCVLLKGFAGVLNLPTQEHTNFAGEFSDRVRVIACLTRLPNMIHSDSASDSLSARDWKTLRRRTGADHDDVLILVWGNERDTATACEEIIIRAREATAGVPADTRQAHKDGTTGFERVLPGAERMYPDTDLPPIVVDPARVDGIASTLPEPVWDREARYRALGLPDELVDDISLSRRADVFGRIVEELKIKPAPAAVVLCQKLKSFRRAGLRPERLGDEVLFEVFKAHAGGRLAREGIVKVIRHLLKNRRGDIDDPRHVDEALKELDLTPLGKEIVEERIAVRIQSVDDSTHETPSQARRHVMGALMNEFIGCFDGVRMSAILDRSLEAQRSVQRT